MTSGAASEATPIAGGALGFSNLLVTGADGFVGGHLVPVLRRLLGPDAQLCLTTRSGVSVNGRATDDRFDLEEPETAAKLVRARRPDLVIHLAGQAAVDPSASDARKAWAVNFGGCFALAGAIQDAAPDCTVVFISSAQVYGRAFDRGPASEDTVPEPLSPYARSKAAAEAMFDDVLPASSRLIVLRPSNHIGPGQTPDFAVPAFAEQIARLELTGGGVLSVGNLNSLRDFLSVHDVVAAYAAVLRCAKTLPSRSTFNVASGQVIGIGEILDRLLAASPAAIEVAFDSARARPNDIRCAELDGSRLRQATGWRPQHDLSQALREALDDFRRRATGS